MRLILGFLLILNSIYVFGQTDSHYWSHQFGARGLLLNGAVISSSEDETAIFYNPGAIAMDKNLGFAFSFLSPTFSQLTSENFLAQSNSISNRGLGFSPGFTAIRFKPFKSDKVVMGLASFTRYRSRINYSGRITDVIQDATNFVFRSDLQFSRNKSEDWYGIALGYKLSDHFGFGVSQFSVWHDQNLNYNFIKEILFSADPTTILRSWRAEFDYGVSISSGWITKLGFSFRNEHLGIGLTATSPMYGVFDSSSGYALEDQRIDIVEPFFEATSNRAGLDKAQYKSPLSIGLGLDFRIEKYKIYFSSEYFYKIDKYTLFEDNTQSLEGVASGDSEILVSVESANESVLNIALGMQYQKSENLTLLAGFRTDFSEVSNLLINNTSLYLSSTPDVFHISGGLMKTYGKNIFSVGVDLGYGRRTGGSQLTDLNTISTEGIFTYTGQEIVNTTHFSFMLFLTYDFIFKGITSSD